MTPKEVAASPEEQGKTDVPRTQDLSLVREGGQFNKLRVLMQGMQKDNRVLHARCVAKKADFVKSLFKVRTLRAKRTAQKMRIGGLTWWRAEELSARERSVAEKRQIKDAETVK